MEKAKRAEGNRAETHQKPTKTNQSPVTKPVVKMESPELTLLARRMGVFIPRKAVRAKEKHTVNKRDNGQCTHIDNAGLRCDSRQWVQVHHVKHHAQGGADTAENLRTLCFAHHRLLHEGVVR